MYLVNAENEKMTILPYHRVLSGLKDWDSKQILASARRFFHIKSYPYDSIEKLTEELGRQHAPAFGFIPGKDTGLYLFVLRDTDSYLKDQEGDHLQTWHLLPVNVLNNAFFSGIMGLTENQLSDQSHLSYTHSSSEAACRVKTGGGQCAFLLKSTTLDDIAELARHGEVLPRKSTYFYPKLLSGLVMMEMGLADA